MSKIRLNDKVEAEVWYGLDGYVNTNQRYTQHRVLGAATVRELMGDTPYSTNGKVLTNLGTYEIITPREFYSYHTEEELLRLILNHQMSLYIDRDKGMDYNALSEENRLFFSVLSNALKENKGLLDEIVTIELAYKEMFSVR